MAAIAMQQPVPTAPRHGKAVDHHLHHDSHCMRPCAARDGPLPNLLPRRTSGPSTVKAPEKLVQDQAGPVLDAPHEHSSPACVSCHSHDAARGAIGIQPATPGGVRPPLPPSVSLPNSPGPHCRSDVRPQSTGHSRRRHQLMSSCFGGTPGVSSPARMPPAKEGEERFLPTSSAECPQPATFSWLSAPWLKKGTISPVLTSAAVDANEDFRPYNEDGYKIKDPLKVHGHAHDEHSGHWRYFAVYDGHGSRRAVDWLESRLHYVVTSELEQTLRTSRTSPPDQNTVAAALKEAFKKADGELKLHGIGRSGSTATVALVHESFDGKRTLYVANVGDSKAVLVGASGAKQLSVDHHATNPAEVARVERDGGCVFRKRVGGILSVTRAFGDFELKCEGGGVTARPHVAASRVQGTKALVLASDGLWDVLSGAGVQQILENIICGAMAKQTYPENLGELLSTTAARDLVAHAKALGSRDNISAVVVFL